MPEGDSAHLAAARLNEALAGRVLAKTDFRVPRFAAVDLAGRRVERCFARGKHILMRVEEETTIHTHLKMEGEWHLYRPGQRWRSPAWQVRLVLDTDEWQAVGVRLGVVEVLRTRDEQAVLGHLGPDPLGPEWDEDRAIANFLAQPADRSVAEILIDQTVIAGLGNVYKSETCFLAGLYPWTPVDEVDAPKVVSLAKRLMEANRATGMQITTGDRRRGHGRWVYGRRDEPCRRCGTPIAKKDEVVGTRERVTYWCPHCQPRRDHPRS